MKKRQQKRMPKEVSVVVVALSAPTLVGIYDNETKELLESYESHEKSSEYLPILFKDLLKQYNIKNLAYAKGPGSFMAIKVAYVFLKTLSITLNISFTAQNGFYFNENSPIKAIGKLFFVNEYEEIITKSFEEIPKSKFSLPKQFNQEDFLEDTEPLYVIPAV